MNYVFEIRELDKATLQSQACAALNKRAELLSRAKHPKLWKRSDRINAGKNPEEIKKKQRRRSECIYVHRSCDSGFVCHCRFVLGHSQLSQRKEKAS